MSWTRRILPHGPIEQLAETLWQVTGSLPRMALPRNMLVYRRPDGRLWIHSAIALEAPAMTELERLGEPAWLIVPNALHTLDAPAYRRRYRSLQVLCPAATRAAIAKKVVVDGVVEEVLPPLGIAVLAPAGSKPLENAYRLPVGNGALAFCDLLFNVPHQKGFGGRILRWLGSTGYFGVTKIGRRLFVEDANALANWLDALAATEPDLVTVAHGNAVPKDVGTSLREAARRLRDGKGTRGSPPAGT